MNSLDPNKLGKVIFIASLFILVILGITIIVLISLYEKKSCERYRGHLQREVPLECLKGNIEMKDFMNKVYK